MKKRTGVSMKELMLGEESSKKDSTSKPNEIKKAKMLSKISIVLLLIFFQIIYTFPSL